MKKCTRVTILSILFCVCLITGCKSMKVEEEQGMDFEALVAELKETKPNEVDSHITLEGTENFGIDADIFIPEQMETYTVGNIIMYRHVFEDEEKEELMKILMDEFEWDKNLISETDYRVKDDTFENGEKETALSLNIDETRSAIVQSRAISADNGLLGQRYSDWSISIFNEIQDDPDYFTLLKKTEKDVLEFCSIEEVKAYAKEFAEKFGIEFDCESEVYAFSSEELENRINQKQNFYEGINITDIEIEKNVSKQDEAYWIVLLQGTDGIPLFPYELSNNITNTTFVGSKCTALYSAQGIERIELRNVYDIEKVEEAQNIKSIGDILETYYNQRGKQTLAKETVIKIRLYYLPICVDETQLKFEARPVWYILSNVEQGSGEFLDTIREAVVYDAVTGEELSW